MTVVSAAAVNMGPYNTVTVKGPLPPDATKSLTPSPFTSHTSTNTVPVTDCPVACAVNVSGSGVTVTEGEGEGDWEMEAGGD